MSQLFLEVSILSDFLPSKQTTALVVNGPTGPNWKLAQLTTVNFTNLNLIKLYKNFIVKYI